MVNKTTFEQLPPEQQSALIDYRTWACEEWAAQKKLAVRKRTMSADWKRNLMNDWSRAGSRWPDARERYGWLHQLRNTYGPSWLESLEVPE